MYNSGNTKISEEMKKEGGNDNHEIYRKIKIIETHR